MASKIQDLSTKDFIIIKGANMHNLKNIDLALPQNKLIVITGLSGSGKSSLAFDTLYAEGQRRYVESLSSYARQFMGKIEKPEVEYILGISPAIAIEQKVNTHNPRSTVGTATEIYDYLKLLFARIGKTFSPVSGKEVKQQSVEDVVNYIHLLENDLKGIISVPIEKPKNRNWQQHLEVLSQQGYSRLLINNEMQRIEELDTANFDKKEVALIIDRFVTDKENEDNTNRLFDSAETAFYEGNGKCDVTIFEGNKTVKKHFSNAFEADGIQFEKPSVHFFSFNNPLGACKKCDGFGSVIGIDEDLVVPDKSLSIYEDAVACWRGEKMQKWKQRLIDNAAQFDFPIHKPYFELSSEQKALLWSGNKFFKGLDAFFHYLEEKSYKIQYRVMISRYRGKTICPDCKGARLRKDAAFVKINKKSIVDLTLMPITELVAFFENFKPNKYEENVAKRLLVEIENRLNYLLDVGLGYLTLNRLSSTLSGGESQRINLATSLGSSLVGSMYILDEPSIGLHPKDTERLIGVLRSLQQIGNTVIVVEHDEEIMRKADHIVDMGPMAGSLGGEVVFEGTLAALLKNKKDSLTAQYLNGEKQITVPKIRRKGSGVIKILGARQNNLKNIKVDFPLKTLTVVTGVSGSGKSSLVKGVLYPALKKMFQGYAEKTGDFDRLEGDYKRLAGVEFVDQNPIGKSSRSNPVTYVKAYDEIRNLYALQPLAKMRSYKPAFFSFNVDGGRCDNCQGDGEITVEMQFMADIHLKCDVCKGKRFKDDIIEIKYNEKSIADVLDMTIDDAIDFFEKGKDRLAIKITEKLKPLQDVGLGYVKLGQSSNTLSGGEAQRVKLASYLSKKQHDENMLFIFDEPTTGLHFHDINKLLYAFNALIEQGNSIIVIEHNPEVIKCADYIIDLGTEGGDKGGNLVFAGTPENLVKSKKSYTAKYIKEKLG